jgi:SWI/SNF related-matrix-associated actin-dependent regulator of chromatin subfamily C
MIKENPQSTDEMQVDPDTRPSAIGPPFTGHFRVIADTPRGIQPLQPAPTAQISGGKPHPTTERLTSATPAPKSELNMEVRRNVYESNGKEATPAESKPKAANGEVSANGTLGEKTLEESLKEEIPKKFCQICGTDCTRAHWHNAKATPKFDVCPQCYKHNSFPSNHNRSDFVKMENKAYTLVPDRESPWSDEELLLLLEGLEMYDDDWNKISDHVGTRTREECVLKFLQLEIEDEYVEPDPSAKDPGLAVAYLGEGRIPFNQVENPVLSVIAFLAGLADPSVTAAAAGKSIDEVQRVMRQRIDSGPMKTKGKEKASEGGEVQGKPAEDVVMDLESTDKSAADKTRETLLSLPFALTAARASALASNEERSLTRLVHLASNLQMQKLELKLQQFAELENLLKLERKDVERRRQSLFLERLEFQRRQRAYEEALEHAMALPPAEAMEAMRKAVKGPNVSSGNLGVSKAVGADEVQPLSSEGGAGYKTFSI